VFFVFLVPFFVSCRAGKSNGKPQPIPDEMKKLLLVAYNSHLLDDTSRHSLMAEIIGEPIKKVCFYSNHGKLIDMFLVQNLA